MKVGGQTFDSALGVVCRLTGYIVAMPVRKKGLGAVQCAHTFLELWAYWLLTSTLCNIGPKLLGRGPMMPHWCRSWTS